MIPGNSLGVSSHILIAQGGKKLFTGTESFNPELKHTYKYLGAVLLKKKI